LDGIINVNKPAGMTSHDVVNVVRQLSRQRRVGHAGTLDPAAEGVLLVCVGKGTKVVEFLTNDRKAYRAEVTLGISTDSFDAEGRVTKRAPSVEVTLPEIVAALDDFRGTIWQVPPLYSAIKRAGQPLYKLARAGREVALEPRRVTIYRLEVIDWQPPTLTLFIECSKGTYIRSLANDLGERLGCGGHLSYLLRVASGRFTLATASTLDELAKAFADGSADELIFALDEGLLDYDALIVSEQRAQAVRNGIDWTARRAVGGECPVRVYSVEGEILAMANYDAGSGSWHPSKVF
jgi:tRNA pseudouridine55 synthase